MLQFCSFCWHFLAHLGTLCYFWHFGTIWVFWAFYAVLSLIRFVVNYALFRVKYFWLKLCLCKIFLFFPIFPRKKVFIIFLKIKIPHNKNLFLKSKKKSSCFQHQSCKLCTKNARLSFLLFK